MFRRFLLFLLVTSTYEANAGTVTDARGVQVETPAPPQRIISNALSSDEVILDLIPSANLGRVIAFSPKAIDLRFSNIADRLDSRLKATVVSSPEQIIAAKPDLVILSVFNRPEFVRAIEKTKHQVFVIKAPQSLNDIYQSVLDIGTLLHVDDAAKKLHARMQEQMATLQTNAKILEKNWGGRKPRVVYYDADGVAIGGETIFDDVVTQIGAENAAAKGGLKGWPKLSLEALVAWQPDVIVAAGETKDLGAIKTKLNKAAGWKNLHAVKKDRIVLLSERELFATSQYITAAAKNFQSQLLQIKP